VQSVNDGCKFCTNVLIRILTIEMRPRRTIKYSMDKEENKKQKTSFLRRYGWGLFCILSVILVWLITAKTNIKPSSSYGSITFFAEVKDKDSFRIVDAPDLFHLLLKDGEFMTYSRREDAQLKFPYPVSLEGNDIRIDGLALVLSEREIQDLWTEEPVVSAHRNKDGSYEISYALDAIGQTIRGIYKVQKDTIIEHYFEQSSPLFATIYTFFIFVAYVLVSIIRVLVRFVQKRKQRSEESLPER